MAFFLPCMKNRKLKFTAVGLAAMLCACAGVPSYKGIETPMAEGDFERAAEKVEKSAGSYSKRSALVYFMDRLITTHLAGQYRASNRYAEKSHRLIDDLYTRSISGEAGTWLLNDSSRDYRGEHFEQIMVHLFSLINYGALGDPEEALVEARRADLKFREHARRHGENAPYSEDALMRWLAAVMYEAEGERDDAFLDYKKTLQAFQNYSKQFGTAVPDQAVADAQRMAGRLRETAALKKIKADFPTARERPRQEGDADLVVIVYEGLAPKKVSDRWSIPLADDAGNMQYFSLAYPRMVAGPPVMDRAFAEVGEGLPVNLELFEDIQAIAIADLNDRLGRIKAKAIARAAAKFKVGQSIQDNQESLGKKALASLFTNLYSLASEQADIRSWRTLPARIHVARLRLKEGQYPVRLRMQRIGGKEELRDFGVVQLAAGRPAFLHASLY
jgi:hypothetical protein